MRQPIHFTNPDELKVLEHVDARASEKYVAIYSTELIKLLAPEFTFVEAFQLVPNRVGKIRSAHYFDMISADGNSHLRFFNSYDRSLALRVSLVADGIMIPLGVDRLVHIGHRAQSFTEDIVDIKKEMLEAAKVAKNINNFMTATPATEDIAKVISKTILFSSLPTKEQKRVTEINNFTELLLEKGISLKDYMKKSINSFLRGDFVILMDGKKVNSRQRRNIPLRLKIENRVMRVLEAEYPEVFL